MKKDFGVTAQLIEGSGGVFDVHADGKQVWDKKVTGRFPEPGEVTANIKKSTASC